MNSHRGFDQLSWAYDFLARAIFGSDIRDAQSELIQKAESKKDWLVIGGGTGWILAEIFKYHPAARVTYVEASQRMIDRSKSYQHDGEVIYILGSVEELPENGSYEVVVTNFFWDMFHTSSAIDIKNKIDKYLKKDTQWLVTDFINNNIWWQGILMKIMYYFFRLTCHIEAARLPDFDLLFKEENQVYLAYFYHGMIRSTIYKSRT